MKHSGQPAQAAFRLILGALLGTFALSAAGLVVSPSGSAFAVLPILLGGLWLLFSGFTLYFFRDPPPNPPPAGNAILSPAHGKVDVLDETTEAEFMGGRCRRISIFLSVIDVHVQNAPVAGRIALFKRQAGKFLSALKTESAEHNENVLIGFDPLARPGEKVAVRLIAGVLARRIVPWVALNDVVERGERISLIQFGSRCELYLPPDAQLQIKLGDHVVGGQTIVAVRT